MITVPFVHHEEPLRQDVHGAGRQLSKGISRFIDRGLDHPVEPALIVGPVFPRAVIASFERTPEEVDRLVLVEIQKKPVLQAGACSLRIADV
jgi:hypothetical protein